MNTSVTSNEARVAQTTDMPKKIPLLVGQLGWQNISSDGIFVLEAGNLDR